MKTTNGIVAAVEPMEEERYLSGSYNRHHIHPLYVLLCRHRNLIYRPFEQSLIQQQRPLKERLDGAKSVLTTHSALHSQTLWTVLLMTSNWVGDRFTTLSKSIVSAETSASCEMGIKTKNRYEL